MSIRRRIPFVGFSRTEYQGFLDLAVELSVIAIQETESKI